MSCLNIWWHDNVWGREAVVGWYDQLRFENNPIWCVWTCGDMIMYEEERQQLVGMTRPAEMERGMQAFSRSRNVIVSPGDKTAREEKYENMARRRVHNKGSLQSLECPWNLHFHSFASKSCPILSCWAHLAKLGDIVFTKNSTLDSFGRLLQKNQFGQNFFSLLPPIQNQPC